MLMIAIATFTIKLSSLMTSNVIRVLSVYGEECHQIYRSVPDQECSTVYEQQCVDEQQTTYETTYEQSCQNVPRQVRY